jgi:hypothetical protein
MRTGVWAIGVCLVFLGSAGAASGAVVTLTATRDATLIEENGQIANGAGLGLFAGHTGSDFGRRAIVRFDLSSIPAGATINSVTFTMNLTRALNGSYGVSLHRALSPWSEGPSHAGNENGQGSFAQPGDTTWTHAVYAGTLWNTPGGDFVSVPSATRMVGTALTAYSWNSTAALVADVQTWLDTPALNYGWFVLGDETRDTTARRFASRHYSNASMRPRVTIDYTPIPAPGAGVLAACGLVLLARRRGR